MFKQAIIVPAWLGMSPGKVASQCCHAALKFGAFSDKRVILRVDSPIQLLALVQAAEEMAVEVRGFVDSEPTTQGTSGTITAWSFRGCEEAVTEVTGKLELY